jgi:ubiquinone biosynthesis UbiH/UbiF/VisC/COQ6 family hydroxylase
MSRSDHDIVIVGGGVAGACSAALLGKRSKVALVDARRPDAELPDQDFDPRVVAISPGSARILDAAGAWSLLDTARIGPYQQMQVHAGPGRVEFRASEHGLDHLGWIVEIPALERALWQALERAGRVSVIAPATIERCEPSAERVRLRLDTGQRLTCGVLVAADGARSRLRSRLGIPTDQWHYNQKALVTHVRTQRPNRGLAWQRFTDHGPLALLPLADGRSSIVWSQAAERADRLAALAPDDFSNELNAHADSPMGAVTDVGRCHALPLVRRRARRLVQGRVALLGDAAHSVHPLAGQGLNIGLADAAALAELLGDGSNGRAPQEALARYETWRLSASDVLGGGIHLINELAHTPGGLGRQLLGVGFGAASRLWPAREAFVQSACGIDSDSPRLARAAEHSAAASP